MAYKNGSFRLKGWDYFSCGLYFITICTKDKEHFFGKIENDTMKLNEIGEIMEANWLSIEKQFPTIETADFVIMPNHFHGILIIDGLFYLKAINDGTHGINPVSISADINTKVELPKSFNVEPNSKLGGITGNKNPMLHRNISTAIRWFKGKTTFDARKINPDFAWQSRFYDHVIRSQTSFIKIQAYIKNNPKIWDRDRNNVIDIIM